MRAARLLGGLLAAALLVGCREVRVKTLQQGSALVGGSNAVTVIRSTHDFGELGIRAPQVHFKSEFAVVLLMGPHRETGWRQIIESIRANESRVRVVAYERRPADGGQPTQDYRTYTLWIVPNSVYRVGSIVEVVSPQGEPVAQTTLR